MIGFKTVCDKATNTEFFVASVTMDSEMPDLSGKTMYRIDLIPFDENNAPCLYNVPLVVDCTGNKTECCLPVLEDIINSGTGCYDFMKVDCYNLFGHILNSDMLTIATNN